MCSWESTWQQVLVWEVTWTAVIPTEPVIRVLCPQQNRELSPASLSISQIVAAQCLSSPRGLSRSAVVAAVTFRADHSASVRDRLWGKLEQENVFAVT